MMQASRWDAGAGAALLQAVNDLPTINHPCRDENGVLDSSSGTDG